MTSDPSLSYMHARVAQCRRLAQMINDPQAIDALNRMAREIAVDIERLNSNGQQ